MFRAKADQKIGSRIFRKGQPVLYIDTAKTSTMEGAADTTYATGGKGNPQLIAWEGNKTLSFSVEDALFSPIGISILAGANLLKAKTNPSTSATGITNKESYNVHVHACGNQTIGRFSTGTGSSASFYGVDISGFLRTGAWFCPTAPVFVATAGEDGSIEGGICEIPTTNGFYSYNSTSGYYEAVTPSANPEDDLGIVVLKLTNIEGNAITDANIGQKLFVDFYQVMGGADVDEIQITPDKFAGYFYVEAHTTYRRQSDGKDLPAVLTFPNVKIQSNFTIEMSADGDPSTATFQMDAFPGRTYFNPNQEVLCAMQIIDDAKATEEAFESVFKHTEEAPYDVYDPKRTGIPLAGSGATGKAVEGYDDSYIVTPDDYTTP